MLHLLKRFSLSTKFLFKNEVKWTFQLSDTCINGFIPETLTSLVSLISSSLFPHCVFFIFFLVLSGWCVGMENSFTAAKHIQRKASPAPMKANCKDFTSVNLPETLRTWPVTDMFIHAWASCLYHKAPEASSFHPAHSSCFYRC